MNRKIIEALELLKRTQNAKSRNLKPSEVHKTLNNKLEEGNLDRTSEDVIEELEEDYLNYRAEEDRFTVRRIEKLKENHYGSLEAVYDKYREYYHIDDTKKIDLLLSIALSVGDSDKNVWMLFVGASGIGKSMLTDPLRYVDNNGMELAYMISDMTTNTLVSGMESEGSSLAPKLDGKITYIPDFSTIVEKRSEDQREIFSQFRNLYDGFAKKNTGGHGSGHEFKVDTTVVGNVTPAIHNKNLIHQSMGTRFLYYELQEFQKKDVYKAIWNDESGKSGEDISREIAETIQKFLDQKRGQENPDVPEEVKKKIQNIAEWTAKMRATGQFDRRNNELRGSVHPEKPTRILKQFKKLYYNLKKLEEDYPDDRALEIIRKIGASCVDPDKRQIYIELDQAEGGLELGDIVDRMGLSRNSLKRSLLEMRNVGILDCTFDLTEGGSLRMGAWTVEEEYEGLSEFLI